MLAGILILVALLALVAAGRGIADARRARRLNRAMHELRRPLQAVALALESASPDLAGAAACLEQARRALQELDSIVNGGREPRAVRRVPVGEVLDSLARRWHFADVEVEPERGCGSVEIEVDATRLAAALDNLVGNALRHGSGVVRVRATAAGGNARFEVRDDGPGPVRAGRARDRRHGHGLRVVADVAASHGGVVAPASAASGGGTLAAISLPVSGGALGA